MPVDDDERAIDALRAPGVEASDCRPCIYMWLLRLIFESYQLHGRLSEKEGLIF